MPETPWWSQPAPTDVLEQPSTPTHDAPSGRPPVDAHRSGARSRAARGRALLLALALVAAGGTGGAVVAAVDHSGGGVSTSAVSSSSSGGGTTGVSRSSGGSGSSPLVPASTPANGSPEAAAATIRSSVVTIEVTGTAASSQNNGFGGGQSQSVSDTGSGVVLRAEGYVLTNNHVIAAALSGGSVHVTLPNGKTVPASIVGHDTTDDLAVLKLTGAGQLAAATFADSSTLKVGQTVLAIGAPLGLSNTVTQGIVSTLHRPVATGEAGASAQSVIDAVQTDAAINPGNSGGALVDLAGHVVGINSAIATTGSSSSSGQSGNIGVGFAIPSNDAIKVSDQLIKSGHATHAQIGISASDAASTTNGAPGLGATVGSVSRGGPAASAGLQRGDLITAVADRRVTDANSLIVAIRSHDPGNTVTVSFTRGGSTQTAKVTLGSAASD